jgi:hypothetical protein
VSLCRSRRTWRRCSVAERTFEQVYIPPDVEFGDDDGWFDDGEAVTCMCPVCCCMAKVTHDVICEECRGGGHQG